MIPDAKFRRNFKFSLFFSLLAGKPGVETGSTTTASATTQSHSNGDFLAFGEKPRIGALACWCLVSASGQVDSNGHFGAFVSGLKIPLPDNRDRAKQRLVRMRRYRWERPRIWCCSRHSAGNEQRPGRAGVCR